MIILLILGLLGQGITDLGVITDRTAILLERCTNRTDFLHFKVELQALRFPSNTVIFTTANSMLKLEDLAAMPPGPVIMGVSSECRDGAASPIALFRLDLRRDPPKPPTARVVGLLNTPKEGRASLTNAIQAARQRAIEGPPLPGESKTYSDHMRDMQRFRNEHRRRSQ